MDNKTCYVIMPFSQTDSCSEDEWARIFEDVFKPAVESVPGYECQRSKATTGNIVKFILEDLRDARVVIADLTDQNPNVFYELGVRHTISNRSIILAQRRGDVPFDLTAYAYHVYEWKTEEGRSELKRKVAELLNEIDDDPNRVDNPVSDFLRVDLTQGADAIESLGQFEDFRIQFHGSSSNAPDYTDGYNTIRITTPVNVYKVSVATGNPQVEVEPRRPIPQLASGVNEIEITFRWRSEQKQSPPGDLVDSFGRTFALERPSDPGDDWHLLYITFEVSGQPIGLITYIKVSTQAHGFPEVTHIGGIVAPFGRLKGRHPD